MDAARHDVNQPLDPSRKEIRLLRIAGEVEGRLNCHLDTVALVQDVSSFTALSVTDPILVNGVQVNITSSSPCGLEACHDTLASRISRQGPRHARALG